MAAVTDAIEARGGAPEIDDDQEKRGEGIDAEMATEPRKSERQGGRGGLTSTEETHQRVSQ